MNRKTRVILLDQAGLEYKKLNELVGQQIKDGKENTGEIQLLRYIKQKIYVIKANPFYGDNLPTLNIPKTYNTQNSRSNKLSTFCISR